MPRIMPRPGGRRSAAGPPQPGPFSQRVSAMAEPDHEKTYEDGKHRRYNLLFAVNGGAFAIAKLLVGTAKEGGVVVGELRLCHLAYGMAAFTTAMVVDIDAFGLRM